VCFLFLALTGYAIFPSSSALPQNNRSVHASASQSPQSFEHLAESAQAAADANRIPEAIQLYRDAVGLRPSWSEGWWSLGTMLFDTQQFREARDAFRHFVSVEHQQPGPGFGMLGLTEFELKDYQRALEALERGRALGLGNNPSFIQRVLYIDGILNTSFAQPEIALVRLTRVANQLAAEHPEAPKNAVLENTELLDAFGLAALRIPKLPTEVPAEHATLVRQAGHAQALVALQDRVAAGQEIKDIVKQNPAVPGVHYMYGVYLLKEDPASAIAEFRHEIEVSPQSFPAEIQLALEFLRTSDYKEGLPYGQKAVALAPDNFVAHVACGRLWLGLGNTARALRELRTAVRLSPGSPDAHFALSRALTEAGQRREAAQERAEFERLKAIADANDRR
jgi:tetratricopeptide (TPR) repeat protein